MMVVDPQYVEPYAVDLAILRKSLANSDGNFTVVDANGNLLFKIKDTRFSLHDRHILFDATDKPVLTFKRKLRSIHGRWQAFKGESASHKDLLFSAKKSSAPKHSTELDVFLAGNKEETECDYKVVGDWESKSCTIYARDGSTTLAEMHDKQNVTSVVLGKDTFGITVYPDVDYVFIIALVVILDEITGDDASGRRKKKKKMGKKNSRVHNDDDEKEKDKKDEKKEEKVIKEEIKEDNEEKEEEEQKEQEEQQDDDDDDDDDDDEDDDSDEEEEHDDDDNKYGYDDDGYEEEPRFDDSNDEDESSSDEDESPKKI